MKHYNTYHREYKQSFGAGQTSNMEVTWYEVTLESISRTDNNASQYHILKLHVREDFFHGGDIYHQE